MEEIILETNMPDIGVPRRGKVRDIYDLGEHLLLVVTDRVSAFDVVLPNGIPGKGKVLAAIATFWFGLTRHIINNHIVGLTVSDFPQKLWKYKAILEGRSILVKKTRVIPIECIVRGYLSGSGWQSYQKDGTVCDIELPKGLTESAKIPCPIFTPSTKAETGHDINISYNKLILTVGPMLASDLRDCSLRLFEKASAYAEKRGIILADSKMEFGMHRGELILIDEIFTPDSSRFWSAKDYAPGRAQDSLDKQIVRDYLLTLDWDQTYPGPKLPPEIVQKTADKYQEILQILTKPAT